MTGSSPNAYSPRWFATFLARPDPAALDHELAFLARWLPRPAFGTVLDLCCGTGRHAAPLAARGYAVVGVDRDAGALRAARDALGGAVGRAALVRADARALPVRAGGVDAAVCLWQSFGYFDAAGNRAVLEGVRRALRPGGRFVLDVYNRAWHAERPDGRRVTERDGVRVVEDRAMRGARLHVTLRYEPAGASGGVGEGTREERDEFDWLLYTPEELAAELETAGFVVLAACAGFDEGRAPSAAEARMQMCCARAPGR